MREIEFRAWDKRTKQMFLVREMFWLVGGLQVDDGATTQRGFAPKDFDIMQYTGLKDKNGKEGYHKDIAKGYGYWTIEWDDNEGGFYLKSLLGFDRLPARKLKEMVIIGNGYENPELLEGIEK